jgi:high-affinity iron transporter
MLSAALIVFREVLEAALIIGIVLTATRGVAGRARAIALGITAGIGGACLVAYFADTLAQAAEGVGPELFNAGILLMATAMLAWHNLWMVQHGRALATEMSHVGQAVATGNQPVQVLAIVVALAVLREGAEVVLFAFGIAAAGTDTGALFMGGLLGIVAGMAVGGALYFGLLRIPTRHLFAVTSGLLVLLAAGMAAQASAFLIQAGLLPAIKPVLWDTSAMLSEKSIFGQTLHTLVGYVDRPAAMQFLVYVFAVVLIGGLTLASRKPGYGKTG